jgi:hypothetical protein
MRHPRLTVTTWRFARVVVDTPRGRVTVDLVVQSAGPPVPVETTDETTRSERAQEIE